MTRLGLDPLCVPLVGSLVVLRVGLCVALHRLKGVNTRQKSSSLWRVAKFIFRPARSSRGSVSPRAIWRRVERVCT